MFVKETQSNYMMVNRVRNVIISVSFRPAKKSIFDSRPKKSSITPPRLYLSYSNALLESITYLCTVLSRDQLNSCKQQMTIKVFTFGIEMSSSMLTDCELESTRSRSSCFFSNTLAMSFWSCSFCRVASLYSTRLLRKSFST